MKKSLLSLSITALTAATFSLPAAAADDAAIGAKCAPAKMAKESMKHNKAQKCGAKCAAKCSAKCGPKCGPKCAPKCAPKCGAK